MQKKILITVSDGSIARNIVRTGVVRMLTDAGHLIVLAVARDKYGFYCEEFTAPGVEVLMAPDIHLFPADRLISFLGRNAFATQTIRMLQKTEIRLRGLFYLGGKARKKIRNEFIWKLDGRSAQRTADAVISSLA